ncbi:helix-turn-helix domain-containing protein [Novosphingobium lentum]|uniref:helix-turn-helix domain-containing protein n=1 Tax=Novosphingobium lentum TaxID=145287 RepID=UPI000A4A79C4|nr:helix-turn-helix domain-containing protein [Novosphingobium lentum]
MPARRINPFRVRMHRSYSVQELAACCGVHKNTVRNWQANGLEANEPRRPYLFQGERVRAFLTKANAKRKSPCTPGTIFCFRCRAPRAPALAMVEYTPHSPTGGNLRALCDHCEGLMHRRVRKADLASVMPGIAVHITEGQPRLISRPSPSTNCDFQGS